MLRLMGGPVAASLCGRACGLVTAVIMVMMGLGLGIIAHYTTPTQDFCTHRHEYYSPPTHSYKRTLTSTHTSSAPLVPFFVERDVRN